MAELQNLLRDAEFNLRLILYTKSEEDKAAIDLTNHNFIYSNPGFFNILSGWHQLYKTQDFDTFAENGLSEEMLQNLLEKTIALRKVTVLPYDVSSKSAINTLSYIFYKYNSKLLTNAKQQIDTLLEEYDGPLKTKKKIIEHRWKEDPDLPTEKIKTISIDNPYVLLKDAKKKVSSLIALTEMESEINYDNFKFNSQFQILKTFVNDLKSLDLKPDETEELLYTWAVLFLKGYALAQITLIPPESDRSAIMSDSKKAYSSDQAELLYNIKLLQSKVTLILQSAGELHDDKLSEISQAHNDDNAGNVLNPFFNDLIPYFKSLLSPEGLIKITLEQSQKFEPIIDKEYEYAKMDGKYGFWDDNVMYSNYLFCYYFDYIPFELINPPSEGYKKVFHKCMNILSYAICLNAFMRRKNGFIGEINVDEINGELNTLDIQKYYMIWYMISYIKRKSRYLLVPMGDEDESSLASLMLSILPWRINSDCEDARILEKKIHENIKKAIRDRRSPYPYTWYNYIQKVWNMNAPLNVEEMKKKMNPDDPSNPKERPKELDFDGCCNIY